MVHTTESGPHTPRYIFTTKMELTKTDENISRVLTFRVFLLDSKLNNIKSLYKSSLKIIEKFGEKSSKNFKKV